MITHEMFIDKISSDCPRTCLRVVGRWAHRPFSGSRRQRHVRYNIRL